MNAPADLVSVVIPTHNRCAVLRIMLDALCRQAFPPEQMEVIVVMDGCDDGTAAMLHDYAAPFRLLSIAQDQQGPAAARNNGAAKAGGRLLIFFDDDVFPSPGCLAAHVDAHRGKADHVIVGAYLPALRSKSTYAEMTLRAWWHDKFRAMNHPAHQFSYEDCFSGNCSMSRDLFVCVGGFDATFPCAHEDYELGIRLLKAGATLRYSPAAGAAHHIAANCTVSQMLLRSRREAEADVLIGIRHPEMRPVLLAASYGQPDTRRGRLMHWVAFSHPKIGDAAATLLLRVLDVLQRAQLRRHWQRLFTSLKHYWYLRGLADALGTKESLVTFLEDRVSDATEDDELQIDLSDGIDHAIRQVDRLGPAGVRLVLGHHFIGRISPKPGHEPLRGIHLKRILATDFLSSLFTAWVQRTGIEQHPFPAAAELSVMVKRNRT